MKKKERTTDPAVLAVFEAGMERIKVVTGARTQVQLAEALDVRQSSISDAKRRCSIPDGWLVKLLRTHKVLPDWVLTGEGPQHLTDTNHAAIAKMEARITALTEDFDRLVNRVEDSLDFIHMTDAQLAQRKADKLKELGADLTQIRGTHAELSTMAADAAALSH